MVVRSFHLFIVLLLSLTITVNVSATEFYASPTGSVSGDGSIGNPWDLYTALAARTIVKPGDTLNLRGGTYYGKYSMGYTGTANAPITVRSYPGEWARIDGNSHPILMHDIGPNTTVFNVSDGRFVRTNFNIVIEGELIYGSKIVGNTITVIRGMSNVSKRPHPAGAKVEILGDILGVSSSYTWLRDFEVFSSDPVRQTNISGSSPPNAGIRGGGINVQAGTGTKLINLIVHDASDGVFMTEAATEIETVGLITYGNGWWAPDRGHGHGMYLRNMAPAGKQYYDVIAFANHATGQKVFGYAAHGENVLFDGFVVFGNNEGNFFFGTSTHPMFNLTTQNCYIYSPATPEFAGRGAIMGWGSTPNKDITVRNCYFAGRSLATGFAQWENITFINNTLWLSGNAWGGGAFTSITVTGRNLSNWNWDNNTYLDYDQRYTVNTSYNFGANGVGPNTVGGGLLNYEKDWLRLLPFDRQSTHVIGKSGGKPSVNSIFVRQNKYDAGRVMVVVYNWLDLSSVSADLTPTSLAPGTSYEVIDVQNYFGPPVATGVVPANRQITIPMTSTAVYTGQGNLYKPWQHTPTEFGTFIVRATSGAPTNGAPTVNAGVDQTIVGLTASLSGAVSDDGRPSNTLTSAWSMVSGPGSTSFGNANSAMTTATFSLPGTYVLRLSASDGALSSTDDITIIISPIADTQAPSSVGSLNAVAASNQVNLAWVAATDNVGVAGYSVTRCTNAGCTPTVIIGNTTNVAFQNTVSPATYVYGVAAYDAAGNTGPMSTTSVIIQRVGDITGDGVVNILDLQLVSQNIGSSTAAYDLNTDGTVNIFDMMIVIKNWG